MRSSGSSAVSAAKACRASISSAVTDTLVKGRAGSSSGLKGSTFRPKRRIIVRKVSPGRSTRTSSRLNKTKLVPSESSTARINTSWSSGSNERCESSTSFSEYTAAPFSRMSGNGMGRLENKPCCSKIRRTECRGRPVAGTKATERSFASISTSDGWMRPSSSTRVPSKSRQISGRPAPLLPCSPASLS